MLPAHAFEQVVEAEELRYKFGQHSAGVNTSTQRRVELAVHLVERMQQASVIREPHETINTLPLTAARAALARCCGSERWVAGMLDRRPYGSRGKLLGTADKVWSKLDRDDYLEAFAKQPQLGTDANELTRRFGSTADLSRAEHAAIARADLATLRQLRDLNQLYAARFGFIFVACAHGKTAAELLALLHVRLHNDEKRELAVAAAEQAKITQLRLAQLTA